VQLRIPASTFGMLTLAGLVGLIVATLWKILFLNGLAGAAIASATLFLATTAGLLVVHRRWMAAIAAVVSLFAVVGASQSPVVQAQLANPSDSGNFASTVLLLLSGVIAALGGIGATVQGDSARTAAD
jgi:hypothetical protein